jgi:hypothetical protein
MLLVAYADFAERLTERLSRAVAMDVFLSALARSS